MNPIEKKIQKKVDEVNALIEKASNSDSDNSYEGNLMVVDTNNTWQEPAIYKPIVFRNGVLYIEYYEPYRHRTTKEKILKRNLEFDGYGTLLDIAKQYRSALRKEGIKYAGGGSVGLIGNQKRIDMNHNGKIDAEDFKILRSSMNGAYRKERKYVNNQEDYEVRYAKPRLNRTGYKGKRSFNDGGSLEDKLFLVKRENRVIADFKTKEEALDFIYEYELEHPRAELELIDPNFIPKFSKKYVPEKRLSEAEWMMKYNSSPEARAYSQGGTIQLGGKLHYYDDLYLDYVNNFISVQAFADYYGISKEKANKIIDLGRENNTPNVLSNMKLALLTELWFAVQQKDVSEYPKLKNQLDKYGIRFSIQNKVSEDAREHRRRKALSISEVHEKVTKIWNEYYKSGKSYAGGGKTTFKEKANAIAKKFEGKRVEPKYQKEYGKTYDKEEAKEVGNKIAGSQKAKYDAKAEKGAKVKKGSGNHRMKEVSNLAKKIRKDGEKWTDAIKRAYEQLK